MAVISWGRPDIYIKDLDATSAKWIKVPTPADGTTELSTEKGDKTEAKFEGGEIEDVRYAKNTYSLAYQIRLAKAKTMPFDSKDGVVSHNYAVVLIPEDPTCPGLVIDKSNVSSEDTYSSSDGILVTYTHDALKPEKDALTGTAFSASDAKTQVRYGVLTVTEDTTAGYKFAWADGSPAVHAAEDEERAAAD